MTAVVATVGLLLVVGPVPGPVTVAGPGTGADPGAGPVAGGGRGGWKPLTRTGDGAPARWNPCTPITVTFDDTVDQTLRPNTEPLVADLAARTGLDLVVEPDAHTHGRLDRHRCPDRR